MKPPVHLTNSVTHESADITVDAASFSQTSAYEQLRREGELHMKRGHVLVELKQNISRLEDLHGRLQFMMKEINSVFRR